MHIHIKVRILDSSGNVSSDTTQLFFADSISNAVYAANSAFAQRRPRHHELRGLDLQRRKPALLFSLTGDASSGNAGSVSIGILKGTIYGG